MAKAAPKKTTRPAAKPGRPAAKTAKPVKAATPAKKPALKAPAVKAPAVKAQVVSKDELRTQLEKAQNTIATLRIKSREAVRAAKASAAQIGELEAKVAQLEKRLAAQQKPAKPAPAAPKAVKPRGRKPAAPFGVPVETDDALLESSSPVPAEDDAPAED